MAEPCNHCHQWPCVCHLTPSAPIDLRERVAAAMYWRRVNPNQGATTLSVAVRHWGELPDDPAQGSVAWLCKSFWRVAADAAISCVLEAMREPSEEMWQEGFRAIYEGEQSGLAMGRAWTAMLSAFARTVGR